MDDYLFVYGTLMRGARHPMGALLAEHAEFVGEAVFQGRLYRIGRYPGAVASAAPGDEVFGEVFRLHRAADVLARLDVYEGCGPDWPQPTEFARARHRVMLADGAAIEAWAYLYNWPVAGFPQIASGRFLHPA
jgi:gamma-glutamylcyclotransferase (GGCT)/AIG2-like uncharacterized protein YtfP